MLQRGSKVTQETDALATDAQTKETLLHEAHATVYSEWALLKQGLSTNMQQLLENMEKECKDLLTNLAENMAQKETDLHAFFDEQTADLDSRYTARVKALNDKATEREAALDVREAAIDERFSEMEARLDQKLALLEEKNQRQLRDHAISAHIENLTNRCINKKLAGLTPEQVSELPDVSRRMQESEDKIFGVIKIIVSKLQDRLNELTDTTKDHKKELADLQAYGRSLSDRITRNITDVKTEIAMVINVTHDNMTKVFARLPPLFYPR